MKQYLELIKDVLDNGESRDDRTGTGTISKFGVQQRYDLREGFPLLTTKKVYFRAIVHELLWIISGDTNIKYLVDNNVGIWNEWPFEIYKKSAEYKNETLEEFVNKIEESDTFAKKWGDLGPVYGRQWRNFNGVDQLKNLLNDLKTNPNSRRHIISAWNPVDVPNMALPPCHSFFQFYVASDGFIDLQLYQRSGDIFLGVPFNIASYSLLLSLVAREVNLKPRYFIHTIGDAHVYKNHINQVNEQLTRDPLALPKLNIKNFNSIFEVKYEDIEVTEYKSHPPIKGKVAV